MGGSFSSLGGMTPFQKGSYVRISTTPSGADREDVPNRPDWTPDLDSVVSHIGLVVGGASAESRSSSVAFINFDSSSDDKVVWHQCREEWLEQVTPEQAKEQSSEADLALLREFFEGQLKQKIHSLYSNQSSRAVMSSFGPPGTIVRVQASIPMITDKETGVHFDDTMAETLGVCGVVVQGARTDAAKNATFVVFPLPVGFAFGYSDGWLEKVSMDDLDKEEADKLCALRDMVVREKVSFDAESSDNENQQQEENPLASISERLTALRALVSGLEGSSSEQSAGPNADRRQQRASNKRSGVSDNLAEQLRASHRRELELTRRVCTLEAQASEISALKLSMERIERKIDHLGAHASD